MKIEKNIWHNIWFGTTILLFFISIPTWSFLLTFITPTVAQILTDNDSEFSFYSEFVLHVANFIKNNAAFILIGLSLLFAIRRKTNELLILGSILGVISSITLFGFVFDQLLSIIFNATSN